MAKLTKHAIAARTIIADSIAKQDAKKRLEELRAELRAERISYSELCELQSLAKYIEPGDVELLEAAGVPEMPIFKGTRAELNKLTIKK